MASLLITQSRRFNAINVTKLLLLSLAFLEEILLTLKHDYILQHFLVRILKLRSSCLGLDPPEFVRFFRVSFPVCVAAPGLSCGI